MTCIRTLQTRQRSEMIMKIPLVPASVLPVTKIPGINVHCTTITTYNMKVGKPGNTKIHLKAGWWLTNPSEKYESQLKG